MAGNSNVGKTSFISRIDNEMQKNQYLPIGAAYVTKKMQIEGKSVTAQLWDIYQGEYFRLPSPIYYRGAYGIILLYDITNRKSFKELSTWLDHVRELADPEVVIMLIGSKCDLEETRNISIEEGIEFSNKENLIFFETSSLKNINVHGSFSYLVTRIYQIHINDPQKKKQDNNQKETKSLCNLS
ncbi:ras-related protein Rab11D [Histomonas meleagridis]|uniref:ras-related protein Rab11D n=1 Tax=Histomonas meleagridis TaxID=135588 RepID=UPI00355A1869|nr:ras-related protein Rab11D [Histomonas meleagridis]KAH0796661.1 ras-related protein Rab11D [Histomonas meleagridis]